MKKMLGMVVAVAVLGIASGCATKVDNTTTTREFDPTGKVVLKQTDSTLNYIESNLAKKSIAAGGSVTAIKVVTAADPNTGSFMPTFILGFGTFFMFDLPSGVSAYFHDSQKSMWTAEVGSDTTVLIIGTDNPNKVEISNPELIIDVPGLKVQNPISSNASMKTTTGIKPMGTMPTMPTMPAKK